MVERALQMVEIESVRFDGRVSARDREEALRRLRDDPQARVLLITTSCGAVGYTAVVSLPPDHQS